MGSCSGLTISNNLDGPEGTGSTTPTTLPGYTRTVAAGANIVCEPVDRPYGIREYGAKDPEGQIWWFTSPLD